jgi:CRP-like cAMP-binding protein
MKPFLCLANDYVYQEGDECKYIYFLKSGDMGFTLPAHGNLKYIAISVGQYFGIIDIVASCMK